MNTDTKTETVAAAKAAPSLQEILAGQGETRSHRLRWSVALAVLLGALAVAAWWLLLRSEPATATHYRTEPASTGALVMRIAATGRLQPTNQVQVSSELSGIVEKVFVDDNDRVRRGQVLARLDLSRLTDAVHRSRAALAAAEAGARQARATEAEAGAQLERMQRVAQLSGAQVPSRSELDAQAATAERARAAEAGARAAVAQANAALKTDETNLTKAQIRSPIDGVVLTRSVQPGQTVAASFQAPVLFLLAEDLAQMELKVDIDEADVGQVLAGQGAEFSVDAWPGRRYTAAITRVGLGATEKDGVISYPAVLQVRNSDGSLRPGMTGSADIVTQRREQVLRVPNAALRFTPPAATSGASSGSRNAIVSALLPRPPQAQRRNGGAPPAADGSRRLWVLRDGAPVAVAVKTGASDGHLTEIVSGALKAGDEVIVEALATRP